MYRYKLQNTDIRGKEWYRNVLMALNGVWRKHENFVFSPRAVKRNEFEQTNGVLQSCSDANVLNKH